MVATSGDRLLAVGAVEALRKQLIPLASIITPNLPEAAALLDEPVATSEAAIESQGRRLLALGCPAVLIKGGHGAGQREHRLSRARDGVVALPAPRVPPRTPTAPAARCHRRSPRDWRKASRWRRRCATPRPSSARRSPTPIASPSATATARCIISTGSIDPTGCRSRMQNSASRTIIIPTIDCRNARASGACDAAAGST